MSAILRPPVAGPFEVPAPAWFISDLHLTSGMPRTQAAFERLLERAERDAKALFILGDFFEFWVGDDETALPFPQRVASVLRALGERGVQVYLMHGNRDFLLGEHFAREAGVTLLADPAVIECAGRRVVLSHGDMLCRDEPGYNRFRHWTRKPWVQRFFLALPLSTRQAVARRLRADSETTRTGERAEVYGDVTPEAVSALFASGQSRLMIHGHTHRPAHHETADGERWVLTDWDLDGSKPRAAVLQLDQDGFAVLPQLD